MQHVFVSTLQIFLCMLSLTLSQFQTIWESPMNINDMSAWTGKAYDNYQTGHGGMYWARSQFETPYCPNSNTDCWAVSDGYAYRIESTTTGYNNISLRFSLRTSFISANDPCTFSYNTNINLDFSWSPFYTYSQDAAIIQYTKALPKSTSNQDRIGIKIGTYEANGWCFISDFALIGIPIITTTNPSSNPTSSPTSPPTTNTPTAMPSTSMPSTSIPTTKMPTTNMPSTTNPTTQIPTTNMPSTAHPTTNMPTYYPTTQMPTDIGMTKQPTWNPTEMIDGGVDETDAGISTTVVTIYGDKHTYKKDIGYEIVSQLLFVASGFGFVCCLTICIGCIVLRGRNSKRNRLKILENVTVDSMPSKENKNISILMAQSPSNVSEIKTGTFSNTNIIICDEFQANVMNLQLVGANNILMEGDIIEDMGEKNDNILNGNAVGGNELIGMDENNDAPPSNENIFINDDEFDESNKETDETVGLEGDEFGTVGLECDGTVGIQYDEFVINDDKDIDGDAVTLGK